MRNLFRFSSWFWLFGAALIVAPTAKAIDGISIGGQVGFVSLTDPPARSFDNAIGFGIDIGFKTNALVDLVFSFQTSSHGRNGNLNLYGQSVSADFHVGRAYDFDFTLGAGPGFYFFKSIVNTDTKFGINFGGAVDLLVDDHFKVGVGTRYYAIFGSTPTSGSFWNVMMRAGYLFDL